MSSICYKLRWVAHDICWKLRIDRAKIWLWFVRQLPRKLIYWCLIEAWAKATSGEYEHQYETVNTVTMNEAICRWEKK